VSQYDLIIGKLLDAGYKRYPVPITSHADNFYNKCFYDGEVKKLHVDAYIYVHSHHTSVSFQCQLKSPNGFVFNLETIGCLNIEEAEALILRTFEANNCLNYDS
jgi:hypothetical protein